MFKERIRLGKIVQKFEPCKCTCLFFIFYISITMGTRCVNEPVLLSCVSCTIRKMTAAVLITRLMSVEIRPSCIGYPVSQVIS